MRTKKFWIEDSEAGFKKITAEMEDENHHISLQIWIDSKCRIEKIELKMIRHPEKNCPECAKNLNQLIGISLQHPYFRRLLLKTVGGERGCFHVLELLHEAQDYTRAFFWEATPDKKGQYKISGLEQEQKVRCLAYCQAKKAV